MELTPEERQRIYLEEKARMEARRDIESKRLTAGKVIGWLVMGLFGVYALMWVVSYINTSMESPLARARDEARTCAMVAGNDAERLCADKMNRVLEEEHAWKVKEAAGLNAREAAQR